MGRRPQRVPAQGDEVLKQLTLAASLALSLLSCNPTHADGRLTYTRSGIASWMPEKYGARYLALPQGPGHYVRICGVRCIRIRSMDTGPDQRIVPGRIADLNVRLWEHVCGLPRSRGLCPVTVTFLGKGT